MRTPICDFVMHCRDTYKLNGPVLDVCAGWEPNLYQPLFSGYQYYKQDCVQFESKTIDYVCDAHDMRSISDSSMGTVLLLEALEHIREPQRVVDEIYRILRPGGYCVATTLMTFEIHRCPYDYWRFCPDGICHLFKAYQVRELVLEHHKALPRGIWSIARKVMPGMADTPVAPAVRVHESGTSRTKNLLKKMLNSLGYDLIKIPRDTTNMDVIGVRKEGVWRQCQR